MLTTVERVSTMSGRLESIDDHPAIFLIRNCISMPRLLFNHKSSPSYRRHSVLTQFDETLRQAASTVCNVKFDDTRWQQSIHLVAQGGLGGHVNQIIQDVFNLARHLMLTRSLNVGLHWDANQLRWTPSHSNVIDQQLSTRQ